MTLVLHVHYGIVRHDCCNANLYQPILEFLKNLPVIPTYLLVGVKLLSIQTKGWEDAAVQKNYVLFIQAERAIA